jgi:NAD(P)-dependent dehydrogenase (short-subunit alcohol dehydrogenase family)
MRLKEKVAIVTGGAHGMGEAEARLFAAEGAKVDVADILANDAEAVAADIRAHGGEAMAAKIDVTSEAEWMGLIGKTVRTYGRLDILVNNAGISGSSVGSHGALEGWHRIIAVNQTSVFLGTKLAAEQMAKTGGGSIVNISSIMGFVGSASGHPAYHASKGAVRIYSKAAAVRYGPSGVPGQHGASGLHAADAERDQRRRARGQDSRDAAAPDRQTDRSGLRRAVPGLWRSIVCNRHRVGN